VASHFNDHPLNITRLTVFTGVGDVSIVNETILVVNKDVGAATGVTLPVNPKKGRTLFVKDGAGDANSNAITITGPDAETIDGEADFVINTAYGSVMLVFNGTEWNVLGNTATTGDGSA
jgi:hypothetical protein